jgi:hypothetical protein
MFTGNDLAHLEGTALAGCFFAAVGVLATVVGAVAAACWAFHHLRWV